MTLKLWLQIAAGSAALAFLCVIEAIGSLQVQNTTATLLVPKSYPAVAGSGFQPGAVFPATDQSMTPQNVRLYGSFINGDRNTGDASTAWYDAVPDIALMVSGYPARPGLSLSVDVDAGDRIVPLQVTASNPGERWVQFHVPIREVAGAKRFRIHAVDRATTFEGWVGFSEPFVVDTSQQSRTFGAVGKVAIFMAAFFSLVSAAISVFLSIRSATLR
ncbi:hypothetical protein WPS_29310 [Vulcanimicrobium alpinum]|uniref:Uncharacterized protein n=1 Tax=Vulcanimicrobium alpinum TaxID=3016050 RepID=A0AAN1XYC5_UNVUL|nr:hypothetical protein [Vulcanimicrobium alpinum]BDE07655.1 hypothetical protein WPS_29310 [Vulcanimicrobium alpinum]